MSDNIAQDSCLHYATALCVLAFKYEMFFNRNGDGYMLIDGLFQKKYFGYFVVGRRRHSRFRLACANKKCQLRVSQMNTTHCSFKLNEMDFHSSVFGENDSEWCNESNAFDTSQGTTYS